MQLSKGPGLDDVVKLALEGWRPRAILERDAFFGAAGRKGADVDPEMSGLVRAVVETFLAQRPEIRVLLNRMPSLHRYNIMAFRPRLPWSLCCRRPR